MLSDEDSLAGCSVDFGISCGGAEVLEGLLMAG